MKAELMARLEELWGELARRGAKVNRVSASAHPSELRVKIEHEERRLRVMDEGGFW